MEVVIKDFHKRVEVEANAQSTLRMRLLNAGSGSGGGVGYQARIQGNILGVSAHLRPYILSGRIPKTGVTRYLDHLLGQFVEQ